METKRRGESRAKRDVRTTVKQERVYETHYTRRKRGREETKQKTRVPGRVESFREVRRRENSVKSRFRMMESIGNRLRGKRHSIPSILKDGSQIEN